MSNENKQTQKAVEKTPAEDRKAKLEAQRKKIGTIVVAWLRKFYGAGTDVQKSTGESAELWDLKQTPRGLMAFVVPRSGAAAMPFAILVSNHDLHIKPEIAKKMIEGWNEIVDAGVLWS
jgi:hypothetical protein